MLIDKIIIEMDKIVKTLTVKAVSSRLHPDAGLDESCLSDSEKTHSLGLMRVNHCGEICAQGLYQGQALTSRSKDNREAFEQAAFEETEHLAWTEQRIHELGGKVSVLNPLFYLGSLSMGVAAGIVGDKWNLGFLEETEHQVEQHLNEHLHQLPSSDIKSLAIVAQMRDDERKHAEMAHKYGAAKLPLLVRRLMKLSSGVMTKTTYHL